MSYYNGAGPTDSMTVYRRLVAVHRRLSPTLYVRERLHPVHNLSILGWSASTTLYGVRYYLHGNKFKLISPPINIVCTQPYRSRAYSTGAACVRPRARCMDCGIWASTFYRRRKYAWKQLFANRQTTHPGL